MERSALFFDIDGTILSEITKEIPQSAIEALREVQKRGHLTFINTGRTYCFLPPEVLASPFDGYLCGCGTYLTYHGEVLYRQSLPRKLGFQLLDWMQECHIDGICEAYNDIYMPRKASRFPGLIHIKESMQKKNMISHSFQEDRDFTYDKLFIFTDENSDTKRFLAQISGDMEAVDREGGCYEIVPRGFSKATACEYVLNRFHIPKERCYVFGDSNNDLAMFQYAPHAIAMGKHSPILDPYTEFVTRTVEEDGIAYALKQYGFL